MLYRYVDLDLEIPLTNRFTPSFISFRVHSDMEEEGRERR